METYSSFINGVSLTHLREQKRNTTF